MQEEVNKNLKLYQPAHLPDCQLRTWPAHSDAWLDEKRSSKDLLTRVREEQLRLESFELRYAQDEQTHGSAAV